MYPTGVLLNEKTMRFHPISFRRAPMPGLADENSDLKRYKSIGHHTAGFDSLEEARKFITDRADQMRDEGIVWTWNGVEMPAKVEWFKDAEQGERT